MVTRLLLLLSATAFIKAFQRRTTATTSLLWCGISRTSSYHKLSSPLHQRSCRPWLYSMRYQPLTATTFNDRNPNDKVIIDDENDFQDTEEDDSMDEEDDDDDELDVEDQELHPPKEGSLRLKVRQHVNPLASTYQKPTEFEENWPSKAFAQPNLPTIVDIGCAKGMLSIYTLFSFVFFVLIRWSDTLSLVSPLSHTLSLLCVRHTESPLCYIH